MPTNRERVKVPPTTKTRTSPQKKTWRNLPRHPRLPARRLPRRQSQNEIDPRPRRLPRQPGIYTHMERSTPTTETDRQRQDECCQRRRRTTKDPSYGKTKVAKDQSPRESRQDARCRNITNDRRIPRESTLTYALVLRSIFCNLSEPKPHPPDKQ